MNQTFEGLTQLWNRVTNIGVTPGLHEKDARYIRLTNGLALITGVWLFSLIPFLIPLYPSSRVWIFNSVFFPLLWLLPLYFNHRGWHLFSKLFFSFTSMICITLNAVQAGRASDNHLFLLLTSLFAFYVYPPNKIRYIYIVSLSALLCFVGVEIYLTYHGAVVQAPPEFFERMRLISLVSLCVLVFILTLYSYQALHKAEALLKIEHDKSESLLLNILPPSSALRLKARDEIIADKSDEATILFADIVGFTVLSQKMTPERLVELLNQMFTVFDHIVQRYRLEKIKTIGDAYMVAGGIPEARGEHCEAVARCAIDMQAAINAGICDELKDIQLRVGLHTGPVVAGVIGRSKFSYDLWGDSVNTASRMESHGLPDRIHVSEEVYKRLKDRFEFDTEREIEVKGKGLMKTYFLRKEKAPFPSTQSA